MIKFIILLMVTITGYIILMRTIKIRTLENARELVRVKKYNQFTEHEKFILSKALQIRAKEEYSKVWIRKTHNLGEIYFNAINSIQKGEPIANKTWLMIERYL